jgi:NAD-dependent DNA ligase
MDTLNLIEKLVKANDAYRNGYPLLMTDDEYDACLDQLKMKNPTHPLISKPRAEIPSNKDVKTLPFYVGSLDKVKTVDELAKWTRKNKGTTVVSDKLDGISGIWNPDGNQLYIPGDDTSCLDVSEMIQYISFSPKVLAKNISSNVWIRGELIMPRKLIPEGKLGRSIINGLFHRKINIVSELEKVRFVAYEIIPVNDESVQLVQEQMVLLDMWKIWTPWYSIVSTTLDENLNSILEQRKQESEYDIDGLVIKTDKPIVPRVVKGNPKDAVAWKPPNGESKLTRVIVVEWNASATGKLVPRVQIDPVQLGGSTINYVTGVNARRIVDWKIGPGAMVIIRKGGDVIPLIESVEVPAEVVFPLDGTWRWDDQVNIVQIAADATTIVSQYVKIVKQLKWSNVGPATLKSLVNAGYSSIPLLRQASKDELIKLLGPVKGDNVYNQVQYGWSNASEIDLFIASPIRQDGLGASRLELLFNQEPDFTKWSLLETAPKGWSMDALNKFKVLWKSYEAFRLTEWNFIPYPVQTNKCITIHVQIKGSVVFSGFRDVELKTILESKGYTLSDNVKADTKYVLIADKYDPLTYTSSKIEKARKLSGCKILRKRDWEMLV